MMIIFIVISSIIILIGLLFEIILNNDIKILELNKYATKRQKIELIKRAYFKETKRIIRSTIKTK